MTTSKTAAVLQESHDKFLACEANTETPMSRVIARLAVGSQEEKDADHIKYFGQTSKLNIELLYLQERYTNS